MEVLPVVNCPDLECAAEKLRAAEEFSAWVHLDVSDARFTFGKSWGDPEGWRVLNSKAQLEVHLMVEEPERAVPAWLDVGAKRIIVHVETLIDSLHRAHPANAEALIRDMRFACESRKTALMLAISPETPIEHVKPLLRVVSEFQVLAVHAGPAGQAFLPLSLEKIKFLREEFPYARIEVDGGIDPETTRRVKEAGADVVVSGTYIFGSADPKGAYEELRGI